MLLELKDEMQERRLVILRHRQSRKFHLGGNDYRFDECSFSMFPSAFFLFDLTEMCFLHLLISVRLKVSFFLNRH